MGCEGKTLLKRKGSVCLSVNVYKDQSSQPVSQPVGGPLVTMEELRMITMNMSGLRRGGRKQERGMDVLESR